MPNNISNINNTAHNKNLDKTTFDEQPGYETRVSQNKKILQSFVPNDIKTDTNTKFIRLIDSVRALSPELQCKVLDGLNYANNTLHNIIQNASIATKSSCQSTKSTEKTITFNILDMLDNLTMRQQNIMEEFLRVFTSMYNASAKAEASMSILFEDLVQLQSKETINSSWENLAGATTGAIVNVVGVGVVANAEYKKPAGKIDDVNPNQGQKTDTPEDQQKLKTNEDVKKAKARLAEINNKLSEDKSTENDQNKIPLEELEKEKDSINKQIADKQHIDSHNKKFSRYNSLSNSHHLFQAFGSTLQSSGTVAAEYTRAEKEVAEQAKNVLHSVMSSYLDQINRDVQGRDQALNLLQQIIQTIIDTDSAIVQGIRS
ncbi:hypothetical protein GSY41_06990 [Escherichia coli]|nr:hypothetical protein [Escherichia coli]